MSLFVLFSVLGSGDYSTDTDGDGISDGDEIALYSTDPTNPDTDGDGTSDGDEIALYSTDPTNPDTDGDGTSDGDEIGAGSNPNDPSDGGGMSPGDPASADPYASDPPQSGPDPHADPSTLDSDGDGLTDAEELSGIPIQLYYFSPEVSGPDTDQDGVQGTWYSYTDYAYPDPNNADSDGDLWPDGFEVFTGYHPTNPDDGNADNDGDLLSNGYEYTIGTNWEVANTDGDEYGLSDGIEVLALGTNPLDPNDPAEEPQPGPDETDGDPAAAGGGGSATGGELASTGEGGGGDTSTPSGGGDAGGAPEQSGDPGQGGNAPLEPLTWTLEVRAGMAGWGDVYGVWPDDVPQWDAKETYNPQAVVWHLDGQGNQFYWRLEGQEPSTGQEPGVSPVGDERWVPADPLDGWRGYSSKSTSEGRAAAPGPSAAPLFVAMDQNGGGAEQARNWAFDEYDRIRTWLGGAGDESEWFDTGSKSVAATAEALLGGTNSSGYHAGQAEALQVRLKLNRVLQEGEAPFSVTFLRVVTGGGSGSHPDSASPAPTPDVEAVTLTVAKGDDSSGPVENDKDQLIPRLALDLKEKVSLLPVEFIGEGGNVLQEAKVAKMTEPGVIGGTILDPEKDSDRFYVRITDGASLGAAATVKLGTIDNPDPVYDDPPTEIELFPVGDHLISKSLILVSDDVDDGHKINGIADNDKDDRSHRIQLEGQVQISAITVGGKPEAPADWRLPVKVKKTVKVVLVNCEWGIPAGPSWSAAEVEKAKKVLKERYAQVGVKLEITDVKGPNAGLYGWLRGYPYISGGVQVIPNETRDQINAAPAIGADEVHLHLVQKLGASGYGARGGAIVENYMTAADKAAGYANRAFSSSTKAAAAGAQQADYFTLPHELLHLLFNDGHPPGFPIEFGDSKMLWHTTKDTKSIDDTKRISPAQEKAIHASPLAK